ncbi:MAG: hypothetical protein ACI9VR_000410 [Cognaticolwellia sp.]|jgi:hypothetical protein
MMLTWLTLLGGMLSCGLQRGELQRGELQAGLWEQAELWRSDGVPLGVPAGERLAAQRLFNELLAGAPANILPVDFERRAAELSLEVHFQPGAVLLHGDGGVFAVRLGDPEIPPLILQAPHAWYDFKTGRISCALFDSGVPRALFLNGGQRYGGVGGDDPRFDVAHRHDTLYQAATIGAAQGVIDPLVVQLHGYGPKTSPAAGVVSRGGSLEPMDVQEQAVVDLGRLFSKLGPVHPGEGEPSLAARSNTQSHVLAGQARFLHVELGKQARRDLTQDPELLAAFGQLLQDWALQDGTP